MPSLIQVQRQQSAERQQKLSQEKQMEDEKEEDSEKETNNKVELHKLPREITKNVRGQIREYSYLNTVKSMDEMDNLRFKVIR